MFSLTSRCLFKHCAFLQFKLRQREIVKLMRDLFGPYGSMYDKKALWDFIRSKREVKDAFPEVYRRMQETVINV